MDERKATKTFKEQELHFGNNMGDICHAYKLKDKEDKIKWMEGKLQEAESAAKTLYKIVKNLKRV